MDYDIDAKRGPFVSPTPIENDKRTHITSENVTENYSVSSVIVVPFFA